MRRFSLWIFKLAAAAALSVAVAAVAIGVVAQRLVQRLPATDYGKLKLLAIDFERGWFSSQAVSRFAWLGEGQASQAAPVSLRHAIEHGPLPFAAGASIATGLHPALATIHTVLGADAKRSTGLGALYGGAEPLTITSHIALDGASVHAIAMPPVAGKFAGLGGELRLNRQGTALSGTLAAPSLHIDGPHRLVFSGLRITLDQRLDQPQTGDLHLSLATLETNAAATADIALNDLDFTAALVAPADLVGGTLALKLGRLYWNGTQFGGAALQLKLTRFDFGALQRLQRLTPQRRVNDLTSAEWLALGTLLSRQPEVEMPSLRLQTPWGEAEAKARMVLGNFNLLELLRGQRALWRAVRLGEMDITADATLLEAALGAWYEDPASARAALADAVRAGRLQRAGGDRYRCQIKMQEGKLSINDLAIEPP